MGTANTSDIGNFIWKPQEERGEQNTQAGAAFPIDTLTSKNALANITRHISPEKPMFRLSSAKRPHSIPERKRSPCP